MSHPELVKLLDFLEQPGGTRQADTLDHLTECAPCRARTARLASLQLQVKHQVPLWRGINESTGPRAELHQYVHGAALSRDLSAAPAPRVASRPSTFLHGVAALFTFRLPAWIPATATAAIAVAVLGLSGTGQNDRGAAALVTYQDAPVLHIQSSAETPPGIGFFAGANRIEHPYTGVEVSRPEPRTLALRWPAIEDAVDYRVSVRHVDGNAQQTVADITTMEPQARVVNFEFIAHSRYEWVIEGTTRAGARFSATGGFVVR